MPEPTPPVTTTVAVDTGAELLAQAGTLLASGHRLALVAAHHDGPDAPGDTAIRVVYLFTAAAPDRRVEVHLRLDPRHPHLPSLAALSFPATRFEREMQDLFGVVPDNHPLPRQLVHHPHWPSGWHPMRRDAGPRPALAATEPFPFVTVSGPGVYEIPVGPVHAGLIEPGHFRFSVVGETILRLKARLWFTHKGVEKLFEGRTVVDGLALAERISGDTTVGHALAYCLAVEQAVGRPVSAAAARVRAVLLELERLHNHVADLGALCNDTGYGIAHAHAQRIREQLLRLNAAATGHRLLRGGVFPGGARLVEVPESREIKSIVDGIADVVRIALNHTVVRDRFAGTAVLSPRDATDLGTLGYVARASGLDVDARSAHPFTDLGPGFSTTVETGGDVLARLTVRLGELAVSARVLDDLLPHVNAGVLASEWPDLSPTANGHQRNSAAHAPAAGVGIVEGWRGTIVHRVELAPRQRLSRVKVVDPSFFNWPALPVALAETIVPDFPLTNKSFNLSYAGNDL